MRSSQSTAEQCGVERAENDAVLRYLWVEQLPSWRTSKSIWIVDGYSLATHPDLCERVERINDAAGTPATFRYLYGKPALIAANGVVVAFAKGTHTFCVRLPAGACDTDLLAYNKMLSDVDEFKNQYDTKENNLSDKSTRYLAAIGAKYGRDSNEYEKAGGTRRSERKKSGPRTKPGGKAPPAPAG